MNLDDEACLCFHVTKRKLVNYLRIQKPARASQLSECGGAGTGCGWCRKYLERLFTAAGESDEPSATDYQAHRADYIRAGGGTPPAGATPIE